MNKSKLRLSLRKKRKNIPGKELKDKQILNNLNSLDYFNSAKTILCYVSLNEEVKTDEIIINCFNENKTVAVPRCLDKEGKMDFYIIKSFDDLKSGTFNVREPGSNCERLADFSDSIVIVPGISFDKNGYRLGYGKGYYDRFLKNYSSISIGLCYNMLIEEKLPIDDYDEKVDFIISEKGIIKVNDI